MNSHRTRSLRLNLCSPKVALDMPVVVNSTWWFVLLAQLFRTALLRTQQMSCWAALSWTLAEAQPPYLTSKLIFVLQIFAPDAGGLSAIGDDSCTCTPHPYHFPSSRLRDFLVAQAKSRSTLFLQAAFAKSNLLLFHFSHVSSAARSIKPLREADYS